MSYNVMPCVYINSSMPERVVRSQGSKCVIYTWIPPSIPLWPPRTPNRFGVLSSSPCCTVLRSADVAVSLLSCCAAIAAAAALLLLLLSLLCCSGFTTCYSFAAWFWLCCFCVSCVSVLLMSCCAAAVLCGCAVCCCWYTASHPRRGGKRLRVAGSTGSTVPIEN